MSEPRQILKYDDAAERSYARLRGVSSLVMLPAALLLLLRGGLLGKLLGVAGVVLGVLWLRRAARGPKRPPIERVEITGDALLLHMGTLIREIRFASIESIEADEEALAVRIRLGSGEDVMLPPGYAGLGVDALAEHLRASVRSV